MSDYQNILITLSKDELIKLIDLLIDTLDEKERIEFISKYISPQIALEESGADDSRAFLREVESFCRDCLNEKYYVEPEYDDEYYEDEEKSYFEESKWAVKFAEYFRLSIMHSRNKTYDISYKAFGTLLKCIHKAESNEEILGTAYPWDYLDIDWDEFLDEYYASMKSQLIDKELLTNTAIETWINLGIVSTQAILNHLDDIELIEKSIRKNIKGHNDSWTLQHLLYELLKSFYAKLDLEFNEIAIANSLITYNPNFINDVAQGYVNHEMWEEAVKTIKEGLQNVEMKEVVSALNQKLVDCYEKLNMFAEALGVTLKMFYDNYSHDIYKRARGFATKLGDVTTFIDNTEKHLASIKMYGSTWALMKILSFEGRSEKLIDTTLKVMGYYCHEYFKYTAKSLIYRALGTENILLPNLKEFIHLIETSKIAGIIDMLRAPEDLSKKEYYLNNAVELLKSMIKYHIDAAKRPRYERAAYYCAVMKDICIYLNAQAEFQKYYTGILSDNNRKSALREEMKRKIG